MSEKSEDIEDNILDGSDELDNYLQDQTQDTLTKIISTMFDLHSYTNDPIRVFYMISVIVNRYIEHFLKFYQDTANETLKDFNIVVDLTKFGEEKERMR